MDNCYTMRGCRGGIETLIRKENPHLLDIHGDVVYIAHNSAKLFFQRFDNLLEGFSSDVYYDIHDSPKAKQFFLEIQFLLNLNSKEILRPIETRFLQMLTICNRIHELRDSMIIYYYSFLTNEEQEVERITSLLESIYKSRNVPEEQHKRISLIQFHLAKQKLTEANKARKENFSSYYPP